MKRPPLLLSSARDIVRAWSLLARILVPVCILSSLGLIILHVLYLRNPTRTDLMLGSLEHLIVTEQFNRAATLPAAEVALLGDSSCLMGVDASTVEHALDVHPVQSFCSIGFIGPAAYARVLTELIERNAAPRVLVLMFHPVAFRRPQGWDYWQTFGLNLGKPAPPVLSFPRSSLDYLLFEGISRLIYNPLPGVYATFYGGEGPFVSMIRTRHGSAIDPTTGLDVASLQDLHAKAAQLSGEPADFGWNDLYRNSLRPLAAAIKQLGPRTRTYLVVSPVPDSSFPPGSEIQRTQRADAIAAELGIAKDNILATPSTMYSAYFSGYTHLNRWGQSVFTAAFIKEIAARQ